MKRWIMVSALALATLLSTGWAQAQTNRDDDEGGRDHDRFAFGVGVGLVEPLNEVETYFMAALRIRTGRSDDDSSSRRRETGDAGVIGYIEPEVGYWEATGDRAEGSDLLAGVNLIGVIPMGSVDSFFGVGAGLHFVNKSLLENDPRLTGSETKFGANAQFGIDLYISDHLSAFGAGRFDLVQGSEDKVQSKVYLGLRARF